MYTYNAINYRFMGIFGNIVGVICGFLIIRYAIPITDNLGRIEWAETHLKGGLAGTYTFYKLLGLIILLFSLLNMFGGLGFILSPLSSIFGGAR
jgi:hypothetical protein